MIPLLSVLGAVILLLIIALWLQHREARAIASKHSEFLQERLRAADVERETLLTRIQFYDPNPQPAGVTGPPQKSPVDDARSDPPDDEHQEQMQKRGLRSNTDGGYLDDAGHIFWTFQAYDDWIAYREANKLPVDANPLDHMAT